MKQYTIYAPIRHSDDHYKIGMALNTSFRFWVWDDVQIASIENRVLTSANAARIDVYADSDEQVIHAATAILEECAPRSVIVVFPDGHMEELS